MWEWPGVSRDQQLGRSRARTSTNQQSSNSLRKSLCKSCLLQFKIVWCLLTGQHQPTFAASSSSNKRRHGIFTPFLETRVFAAFGRWTLVHVGPEYRLRSSLQKFLSVTHPPSHPRNQGFEQPFRCSDRTESASCFLQLQIVWCLMMVKPPPTVSAWGSSDRRPQMLISSL